MSLYKGVNHTTGKVISIYRYHDNRFSVAEIELDFTTFVDYIRNICRLDNKTNREIMTNDGKLGWFIGEDGLSVRYVDKMYKDLPDTHKANIVYEYLYIPSFKGKCLTIDECKSFWKI